MPNEQLNISKESSTVKNIPISHAVLTGLYVVFDGMWIILSGAICYYLINDFSIINSKIYSTALIFVLFCSWSLSHFANLYNFEAFITPFQNITKIIVVLATAFCLFISIAYSLNVTDYFNKTWVYYFIGSSVFLIIFGRVLGFYVIKFMTKNKLFARNVIIIGSDRRAEMLIEKIDNEYPKLNNIMGIFDDRLERTGPEACGYPVLGNLNDLQRYIRNHKIDDVIITLPWSADERLYNIARKLRELPVHIYLSSDLVGFRMPFKPSTNHFIGVPMIEIVRTPFSDWMIFIKKVEDIIFSIIALIIFGPLMLIISALIWMESPGPVIFKQKRYGYNNRIFEIYKFRSMTHQVVEEEKTHQAVKNDPRITRLGKFIRKTSLDELPQIINVLNGSMSLVGPRPHAVDHNEDYAKVIDGYFARHRVKPGITGWAQINGYRGITDTVDKMENRVKYDVYYAENWSFFFDLNILFRTIFVGFISKNSM
ncbi:MAG: undecaprenyl-phosphate glucose phosphotransferase [Emcibacteraceae bacterium]|nr:undecaprenyl-phosphate glucose phosphotransferase [Emcibacteraceae bacterium]